MLSDIFDATYLRHDLINLLRLVPAGVGQVSLVLRESGWATTMTATIGDLTFTAQVTPSWARGWVTVTLDGQQRNALLADLHAATTATVWPHAEPSGVTVHPHTEF